MQSQFNFGAAPSTSHFSFSGHARSGGGCLLRRHHKNISVELDAKERKQSIFVSVFRRVGGDALILLK
jgi:hypothetical protein